MAGASGGLVGKGALLLQDVWGEKANSTMTKIFSLGKIGSVSDHLVLKGILLCSIPDKEQVPRHDEKPAHNYRVYKNDMVTLFCSEQEVAPLTNKEFELLNGIKSSRARYEVFLNGVLDWSLRLIPNDMVYVILPSKQSIGNIRVRAVVRWIGVLPNEDGIHFGVEIMDEQHGGAGYTNGFFCENQFFTCDENCGMFESLDKLAPTADQLLVATVEATRKLSQLAPTNKQGPQGTPLGQGPKTRSRSRKVPESTDLPPSRYKTGDRVVVHNKEQIAIYGTVRWIGTSHSGVSKVNAVGIETDVSVTSKDFLIALSGTWQHFRDPNSKHGKVVLPESLVLTETEHVANKASANKPKQLSPREGQHCGGEHEEAHRSNVQSQEREMLKNAKIETQALDQDEQEKLLQGYKQQQVERRRGEKSQQIAGSENERSEQEKRLQPMSQDPGQASRNAPTTAYSSISLPRPSKNNHVYEKVSDHNRQPLHGQRSVQDERMLGHHSNSAHDLLSPQSNFSPQAQAPQPSSPGGGYYRGHGYPNQAHSPGNVYNNLPLDNPQSNFSPQPQALQPSSPGGGYYRGHGYPNQAHSPGNVYNNLPLDNPQPTDDVKAYAPPPQGHVSVNFTTNSAVQVSDPPRYGVIRWIGTLSGINGPIAGVELEENMDGCFNGTLKGTRYFSCKFGRGFFCPVSCLAPDERNADRANQANLKPLGARPHIGKTNQDLPTLDFSMGSTVQVVDPQAPQYGVVQWIGTLPGSDELLAGIELEEYADRCGDGTWEGVRYFSCDYGRAFFCPVSTLKPDQRFAYLGPPPGATKASGNPLQVPMEELVNQTAIPSAFHYVGNERGVQGYQNSCYLDSTLFGLFALSDVFDSMFLGEAIKHTPDQNRIAISEMLWKGIVNPLRKNGVVRYESVMMLRNKLDELGKMEGIKEKEKDPEEFLNMLFKHMLRVSPFISIRRPFGIEQEFFVQLFVEFDENLRLPTVGKLLCKMFKEQQISFTKVPSRLLIQVPRFGREFKTYQKIVPDLKLDITDLTDSYTQAEVPDCMFCGERSLWKCTECQSDFKSAEFCDKCWTIAHRKKERAGHHPLPVVDVEVSELDLLSVICIETNHYVCFTRDQNDGSWIFFDSMANRLYGTYNIPKVIDCTAAFNEWVYPPNGDRTRLMSTQPQQLPELVRRFTQDVYMCVYIQPDVGMYGDVEYEVSHQVTPTVSHPQLTKLPTDVLLEMERIKQKNTRLFAEKANLSLAREELQQDISALKQENQEMAVVCRAELEDCKVELSSRKNELLILSSDFESGKKELAAKEGELAESSGSLMACQTELDACKVELSSQNSELLILRSDFESGKKELAAKENELAESSKSLTACQTELDACKGELSSQNSELLILRSDFEGGKKELAAKEDELAESSGSLMACQTQLDACKAELSAELVILKKELEATKKELAAHNIGVWKVSRDRVRMEKEIGNGGWGAVFEGKIRVAIKRLHPAILTPHNLTRLQREMRLLAEVRHPNLVQFIGAVLEQVGTEPPLIITELLDMNLREAYEQKVLQPENRLSIFIDVARALDYLHQRYEPIIHRDVSAPNILLQRLPNNRWKGKVSDLGSANFLQNAQTMGEGAILYSPPEVIPQAFDPDAEPPMQSVKIDVYSYGVVLCEVNASQFPSADKYRNMIRQVQREQPQMYVLIIRCTKKDPNDRPTMAEVLVELENMSHSR